MPDSPEEVHALFCRFMREGDLEALLTLYDDDAVFCNRAGELRVGRDALREELRPLASAKTEFRFRILRKIATDDVMLVHARYEMGGPEPQSGHAVEVFLCHPEDGWRFLIGDPFTIGAAG